MLQMHQTTADVFKLPPETGVGAEVTDVGIGKAFQTQGAREIESDVTSRPTLGLLSFALCLEWINGIHCVSKKLHIILCGIFSRRVDRLQKFQRLQSQR